jgi:hypothetical protein
MLMTLFDLEAACYRERSLHLTLCANTCGQVIDDIWSA